MNKKDILLLQETERKRIAEALHDTTVQDMVYLSQQLELVLLYLEQDVIQARLEVITARHQIKNIIGKEIKEATSFTGMSNVVKKVKLVADRFSGFNGLKIFFIII